MIETYSIIRCVCKYCLLLTKNIKVNAPPAFDQIEIFKKGPSIKYIVKN